MYFFINEKYKIKWRSLSTYRSFTVFDALIKNTLADLPVLVFRLPVMVKIFLDGYITILQC